MEQVNKDRVIAVAVNTFFKYFVTGIIEADDTIPLDQRFEPAYLKRLMLEHYEQVSVAFNREVFFTFARMNTTNWNRKSGPLPPHRQMPWR